MNIKIRRGTMEDLKAVQSLSQELFEYEKAYTDQYDLAWSFSPAGKKFFEKRLKGRVRFILIAELDKQIVGYAAVWIGKLSWRLYNPIAEIVNLCVSPAFRGSGVGTALMGEIAHIAQARGVKRLQVTALSQNDPALHFYRKHGFSDVDIILEKDIL